MDTSADKSVARLSKALTYPTVSAADPADLPDPDVFRRFEDFLTSSFPEVSRELTRESPGDPGLLYTWPGTNADADPIILTAHYDVVPADKPEEWTHAPFGGEVADRAVWGRGALDDKSSLMAILEATERLLETGFQPERTVLFAFGGDEEVSGQRGASRIAAELQSRGVRAACLVDEGTAVVENTIKLIERPVALVGMAEKGYVDVRLAVRGAEGHASMPSRRTATGRLARALCRIERRPFPTRVVPSVHEFLSSLAEAAPMVYRPILRRPRLFAPILKRVLAADPKTDALVRTTQSPTMLSGSGASNVLPGRVEAVVNVRILPGETIETVLKRFRRVIADPSVEIDVLDPSGSSDPVAASPVDTDIFRSLCTVISKQFQDAVLAPYLVTATTDSKHYRTVARAIYRFLPVRMDPAGLDSIHGVNERIGLRDYRGMIEFYSDLIATLSNGAEHT
ncbi:MAG: M20/M25/M40 family metallo-hydrolase [bacterium]